MCVGTMIETRACRLHSSSYSESTCLTSAAGSSLTTPPMSRRTCAHSRDVTVLLRQGAGVGRPKLRLSVAIIELHHRGLLSEPALGRGKHHDSVPLLERPTTSLVKVCRVSAYTISAASRAASRLHRLVLAIYLATSRPTRSPISAAPPLGLIQRVATLGLDVLLGHRAVELVEPHRLDLSVREAHLRRRAPRRLRFTRLHHSPRSPASEPP